MKSADLVVSVLAAASLVPTNDALAQEQLEFPTRVFSGVGWGQSRFVADFDRDGALDVLVMGPSGTQLHRGDGHGAFGPAIVSTLTNAISPGVKVAVRDFNGDGRDDLCGSRLDGGSSLGGTIDTYFGAANGQFGGPASTAVGETPRGLCAGDFDADGIADIAYAQGYAGGLRFARGDGSGRFTSTVRTPVPAGFSFAYRIQVDRFDRDQRDDVAFLPPYGSGTYSSTPLAICLRRLDGAFLEPIYVPLGYEVQPFVTADVDNDGRADLFHTDATTYRPTS